MSMVIIANMFSIAVFAGEIETQVEEQLTEEEAAARAEREAIQNMPIQSNEILNWPQGPSVLCEGAILMDAESGAILYAKNIDNRYFPASITKALTVLVALENASLTDTVNITQKSIDFLKYGDAHIGMRIGETISLEDALYAVLLASANEVSYAVAESVAGTEEAFIQMMNDTAAELGCKDSHFENANGLHHDNHYTTARDMALIASALFSVEESLTIMQTTQHTIPPTNLVDEARVFQQNHKMVWPGNRNYYEPFIAGKTGFTDQARTTLITGADNGEMKLVVVQLKSYGAPDVYENAEELFEYGFTNFTKVSLNDKELPENVEKLMDSQAHIILPIEASYAEVKTELSESEEELIYLYNGNIVGRAEVQLKEEEVVTEQEIEGEEEQEIEKNSGVIIVVVVGSVISITVIVAVLVISHKGTLMHKKKLKENRIYRERNRRKRRR